MVLMLRERKSKIRVTFERVYGLWIARPDEPFDTGKRAIVLAAGNSAAEVCDKLRARA